ncbi:hypothetical protein, partial [Bradyrhizobium sp. CW10]|uniref:hypothetical protein n=1 Tax=Bradyrhizobium sp. CW10 TaxID=2782683 RepID=UPI001FF87DFD
GKDPAPPSRSAPVAASHPLAKAVKRRVNHKSSFQGIPIQKPAFQQNQLRQNAVSGFQINSLGFLH